MTYHIPQRTEARNPGVPPGCLPIWLPQDIGKQMPLVHDPLRYATHQCGLANLCRTCLGRSLSLEPAIAMAASQLITLLTPLLPVVLRLALPVLLIFRPVPTVRLVALN